MLQRNTPYISGLRPCLRLQALFLCFFLIVSFSWHESGFNTPASIMSAPAAVAGQIDAHDSSAVNQDYASHRLPALLTPAANRTPGTGLRPGNRDDDFSPQSHLAWALAGDTPRLPSLRIDPIAWDIRTPSFLLPSAYGLVPFALPPPLCLR